MRNQKFLTLLFVFATFGLVSFAFAQGAPVPPPAPPPQPSFGETLARMAPMFLVVMVVFHFFIIRPQKQKEEALSKLIKDLKAGDSVVTSGGIIGKVINASKEFVTLEISQGVKVKFETSHIVKKEGSVK